MKPFSTLAGTDTFSDHQMKMIVHQAIGMHLPIGLCTHLAQGLQEEQPIRIVTEDGFFPVAAIQEVIDRPFVFHSELAGHDGGEITSGPHHLSILRTDTFSAILIFSEGVLMVFCEVHFRG